MNRAALGWIWSNMCQCDGCCFCYSVWKVYNKPQPDRQESLGRTSLCQAEPQEYHNVMSAASSPPLVQRVGTTCEWFSDVRQIWLFYAPILRPGSGLSAFGR